MSNQETLMHGNEEDFLPSLFQKYFKYLKIIDHPAEPEKSKRKQEALKKFDIVFGYYLFMDENSGIIDVNPLQWDQEKQEGNSAYNIPFELAGFNDKEKEFADLIERLRTSKKSTSLNSFDRYPFEYRFLPNPESDKQDNSFRQTPTYEILEEHNFSVVLSGEILFWIVLKYGRENQHVKVLFNESYNNVNETQLEGYVQELKDRSDFLPSDATTNDAIELYKEYIIDAFGTKSNPEVPELIEKLARFDIDLSLDIALKHPQKYIYDFFVFPIVSKNNVKIKYPILLCCFIKNIAELTEKRSSVLMKEGIETLDGFKVTEMMCEHFSKDFVDEVYYGNVKYAEKKLEAEKSAKAAIMARNMSHNLGSHILFYLKESLKNVDHILSQNVLDNLHELIVDKGLTIEELHAEIHQGRMKLPYLVGLGRFLNYLQERQEFIATICGDKIPAFSTMNFKEYIIDEFTYDHKITRHLNAPDNSIVPGEIERNIILSFIAKSEKYNGAIDDPDHPTFNQDNRNLRIHFNGSDLISEEEVINERVRNLDVEIPGGIIGRQAFFSILENLIRNSAKHADRKDSQNLTLNIQLNEKFSDIDYQEIRITQEREIKESDYLALRTNLEDKLIDENLKLNQGNKGLKEIKISAAYLLGIQNIDQTVSFQGKDRSILEISMNDENHLVFSFLMRKPKELVYVTSNAQRLSGNQREKLIDQKWQVVDYDDFLKLDGNFKLTVAESEFSQDELNVIKQKSSRFLIKSNFLNLIQQRIENLNQLFIDNLDEYLQENIFRSRDAYPKILIDDGYGAIDPNFKLGSEDAEKFLLNSSTVGGRIVKSKFAKIHNFQPANLESQNAPKSTYFLPNETEIITLRKHLKTEESVTDKWQLKNESNGFYAAMEEITGNNATSRIVRNDIKDSFWYRRVIEAGLLRVLLIDERMHDVYCEKDDDKKMIKNKLLELKNIHVADYNGYEKDNGIPYQNGELRFANDSILAEMSFEDGHCELDLSKNSQQFHICSIHQGIIDKIASSISGNEDTRDNKLIYEKVYRELRKKLPYSLKFIVHSGRSRPPFLPEEIAFLPFASLENLIEDAKVSFVSQLIDAKV